MRVQKFTVPAGLCLGFAIFRFDRDVGRIMEILYAVTDDAVSVLQERERSNSFPETGFVKTSLSQFDLIDLGAEFIGNYKIPEGMK